MKRVEWFTAYHHVVPADYEKWFEDLAAEGWHPVKISHISSMRMVLEKGEPKKYKYAMELLGRMTPERKAMYTDFGWEYVGRMSSIFVWRKEYTDKKPEMFSDPPTRIKRSHRFVVAISFSFWLFVAVFLLNVGLVFAKVFGALERDWLDLVLQLVIFGGGAGYLYSVIRKIRQNKEK